LAARWVAPEQSRWYNSWAGAIEAGLGLAIPPASGALIRLLPDRLGYHVIFGLGVASLTTAAVILMPARRDVAVVPTSRPSPRSRRPPIGRRWFWLLLSFSSLGLRDGLYFVIPGLLLFIVSQNAEWLGLYTAMQALLEGGIFFLLAHWQKLAKSRATLVTAATVSLLGVAWIWLPLRPVALFGLGALVACAYPPLKVALESRALEQIQRASTGPAGDTHLTAVKEVAINGGRVVSLLTVVAVVGASSPLHGHDLRLLIGLWAFTPVATVACYFASVWDKPSGTLASPRR
jgi:hypothetical protein